MTPEILTSRRELEEELEEARELLRWVVAYALRGHGFGVAPSGKPWAPARFACDACRQNAAIEEWLVRNDESESEP